MRALKRSMASRRAAKSLDSLQFLPDALDARRVLHRLAVVGGVAFAIEVALAHHLRRKLERARDAIENVFDHQHALRSAEAAERRLRSLMRLADEPVTSSAGM